MRKCINEIFIIVNLYMSHWFKHKRKQGQESLREGFQGRLDLGTHILFCTNNDHTVY